MSLITVRDDTEEKKNVGGAVLFLINEPFQVFVLKKKKKLTFEGLESIALFNAFL